MTQGESVEGLVRKLSPTGWAEESFLPGLHKFGPGVTGFSGTLQSARENTDLGTLTLLLWSEDVS